MTNLNELVALDAGVNSSTCRQNLANIYIAKIYPNEILHMKVEDPNPLILRINNITNDRAMHRVNSFVHMILV